MRLAHFAAGFVPPRLSVEDLMTYARAWPKTESNALVQPKRAAKRSADASLMPMYQAANALIHSSSSQSLPNIAQPPMLSQPAQLALPAPAGDHAAVPAPAAEPERTPARCASSVGRSPLDKKTPARTPARVLAGGLKGAASALAEAHYNKSLSHTSAEAPAQAV